MKSCLKQPLAQGFFQADGAHLQGLGVSRGSGLPPLVTSRIRASADLALLRGAHRGAPGLHLALKVLRGVCVREEVRGQTCLVGGCSCPLLATGTGKGGPQRHRKAGAELISLLAYSSVQVVHQKLKCLFLKLISKGFQLQMHLEEAQAYLHVPLSSDDADFCLLGSVGGVDHGKGHTFSRDPAVNDPGPLAATAQGRAVPGHPPWASHSRGKPQGRNAATEFINI